MKIAFVRTRGQRDRIYVVRSDGSEVSWAFPTYGDRPPHDLVHWVVETVFGLKRGFWGRVDAGVDPARINADANRAGGKNKYAAFGDDLTELWLAERLAGGLSSGEGLEDLDPKRLARAREVLARLAARWAAIEEKGAIELSFDPEEPSRSLIGA